MGLDQRKAKEVFHPLYFLFSIVMWILVVSWMIVIFSLSSETGDVSAVRSHDLVQTINNGLKLYLNEAFVRKAAHVFEFLVLSILASIAMFATKHIQSDVSWNDSKFIQMDDNGAFIETPETPDVPEETPPEVETPNQSVNLGDL